MSQIAEIPHVCHGNVKGAFQPPQNRGKRVPVTKGGRLRQMISGDGKIGQPDLPRHQRDTGCGFAHGRICARGQPLLQPVQPIGHLFQNIAQHVFSRARGVIRQHLRQQGWITPCATMLSQENNLAGGAGSGQVKMHCFIHDPSNTMPKFPED